MADPHVCRALFCEAQVARDKLMCKRHWYTVPLAIRRRVNASWRAYRGGSGADHGERRERIRAYRAAVDEAVKAVAEAEGAPS